MLINKVLNNNAVTIIDHFGEEVIIKGKGIAFQKKAGDILDEQKIEKTFVLQSKQKENYYQKLLQEISSEVIEICESVIEEIILRNNSNVSDQIYITLTDHINSMLQRRDDGLLLDSVFLYDLKRLYPNEYQLATQVKEELEKKFEIDIPQNECDFITLHIINAQLNGDIKDTFETTSIINSICDIIESDFNIKLDRDSTEFTRFLIHLRVFFDRIINNTLDSSDHQSTLMDYLNTVYPEQQKCLEKICTLISMKYNKPLNDEKLYLCIHLIKLTTNSN